MTDTLVMPDIPKDASDFQLSLWNWSRAAVPFLRGVSTQYHGYVFYGTVKDYAFAVTGEDTKMLINNWIGDLLGKVLEICDLNDLPPLSALVVRKEDGMVGDGFDYLLWRRQLPPLEGHKLQVFAAQARLECYEFSCPRLPEYPQWCHTQEYAAVLQREERRRLKAAAEQDSP